MTLARVCPEVLGLRLELALDSVLAGELLALAPEMFEQREDRAPDVALDLSHLTDPGRAITELTASVLLHTPLLGFHAAVVETPSGVMAFPGHSGLGKTTLAAAFLLRGHGYLSDEALAIDRHSGIASPFPRPLALEAPAWDVLSLSGERPAPGVERLIAASSLGRVCNASAPVSDIVIATRRTGDVRIESCSRGEAVALLLSRSFNHYRDASASFRATVNLVRSTRVWRAGYENAFDLVTAVESTLSAAMA